MRRNAIRNCQVKKGKTSEITKGKQTAIKKAIATRRQEWDRLFEKYNCNSDENVLELNRSTGWDISWGEVPRSSDHVESGIETAYAYNLRSKNNNERVIENKGDDDGQSFTFPRILLSPSCEKDDGAPVKCENIGSVRNRSFQTYMNPDHSSKNSGVLVSPRTRRNDLTKKNEKVAEDEVEYRLHSEDRCVISLQKEDSDGGNFTLHGTVVSSPSKTGVLLSLKSEKNDGVLQGFTYFPEHLCEDKSERSVPDDLPSKKNKMTKKAIERKIKKEPDSDDQNVSLLVAHSPFSNSVDEGLPLECNKNGGVNNGLFQISTNLPQHPSEENFMLTDQPTKRNEMTETNKNNNIAKDDINENISSSCSKTECKGEDEKKQDSARHNLESVRSFIDWNVEFSNFIRYRWNYFRKNPGKILFPLPKIKSSRKVKRLDWQSIMDGTCEIE